MINLVQRIKARKNLDEVASEYQLVSGPLAEYTKEYGYDKWVVYYINSNSEEWATQVQEGFI